MEKETISIGLDLEKLDWGITFDAVDDAIWILSHDQKILRANKKSEELFKQSAQQMIGKYCWEIAHGTLEPITACPIRRSRDSKVREMKELQIGEKWYNVTVDPIYTTDGRYNGSI